MLQRKNTVLPIFVVNILYHTIRYWLHRNVILETALSISPITWKGDLRAPGTLWNFGTKTEDSTYLFSLSAFRFNHPACQGFVAISHLETIAMSTLKKVSPRCAINRSGLKKGQGVGYAFQGRFSCFFVVEGTFCFHANLPLSRPIPLF